MSKPIIGFIGLGEMGAPMARNLLSAGYRVIGFDIDESRMEPLIAAGMHPAQGPLDLLQRCEVLATSLPSSDSWVEFMQGMALDTLREGQIVIDFGTVVPTQSRRIAQLLRGRGIALVEAPVSGGRAGAEAARLYLFAGGEAAVVQECMPILRVVAGDEHITYCGGAGCGQIVKGVNQLMMGLANAAYLEAISFGVNAGVPATVIHQAIGSQGYLRADFHHVADAIVNGRGKTTGVKYRELPYFLEAAAELGFNLPITTAVRSTCEQGEHVVIDDHRPAPSYWHELTAQTKPLP